MRRVLWVVLGAAAVLGASSGDLVRVLDLRGAWVLTVVATAASTALQGLAPSALVLAALAGCRVRRSCTSLSGVLVAWGSRPRPTTAGRTTATLFVP